MLLTTCIKQRSAYISFFFSVNSLPDGVKPVTQNDPAAQKADVFPAMIITLIFSGKRFEVNGYREPTLRASAFRHLPPSIAFRHLPPSIAFRHLPPSIAFRLLPPSTAFRHLPPSIAFRHLPPNSARTGYATEGALFVSAKLSIDAVSALRKVWVLKRLWKLESRGTSVRIRYGSPFSSKAVVCGHCLVTLTLTINETLKWLSSLPILMLQESFRC